MSLPIYQRVVQTITGAIDPSATYTVVDESTGLDTPVYTDRGGLTLKPEPYSVDSNGKIEFFIPAGITFRVAVTGATGSYTERYIQALHLTESTTDTESLRLLKVGDNVLRDTNGILSVTSISALPPATGSGNKVNVTGYHAGTTVGGGELIDFGLARHDGVLYFDPNRAFPSDWSDPVQVVAWYADSGIDADCWARVGVDAIHSSMAGAGNGGDQYYSMMAWGNTPGALHILDDGDYGYSSELIFTVSNTVYMGTRKAVLIPSEVRGLQINAQSNVILKGFTVSYPVTSGNFSSILLLNCDNCVARELRIKNTTPVTESIKAKDCNGCVITENWIEDSKGAGIFLEGTILGRGKNNTVSLNRIDGTGFAGIYTRKNSSDTNTNNIITANNLTGIGRNSTASLCVGIEAWGDGDIVSNNTVLGHTVGGSPSQYSIIGVTIGLNTKCSVTGNIVRFFSIYGIEVGNESHSTTVTGNVVSNIYDDATAPSSGVGYSSTGTFDSNDLVYSSNTAFECFTGFKADFGTRIKLIGNNFLGKFDRSLYNTRGIDLTSNVTFAEVTGNTIRNFNLGVFPADGSVSNESVRIDGNFFDGCVWGVRSLNKAVNINSNTFHNCGVAGTSAAIGLESGSGWTVDGNKFTHDTPTVAAIVVKNELTDHGGNIVGNKIGSGMALTAAVASWVQVNVKDTNYLNDRRVTYGAAVPGSGTFSKGDKIYNTNPTVDGNNMILDHWICTVSGTPGTWSAQYISTVSPAT